MHKFLKDNLDIYLKNKAIRYYTIFNLINGANKCPIIKIKTD
tara:strand:+ start:212 stop:337 length:126 start_codon:yes stop_codon:yes gene_type:complete